MSATIAPYGSGLPYARIVPTDTSETPAARSVRSSRVHSTVTSAAATAIDSTDHGLNAAQPSTPATLATRPPSQNHPDG